MASRRQKISSSLAFVIFALAVGTLLKLWLALTTIGTNDVIYWQRFLKAIGEVGSVAIYSQVADYNHPPLMSAYLWLAGRAAPYAPNGFPFLIRLPAILADIGSTLLLYRLLTAFWNRTVALQGACLFALSPVLILVSGFHGNTDPVFLFGILLAAERLLLGKNPFVAGLALGFSLNIKIVPVLTLPIFFFWLEGVKAKAKFGLACGLVLLVGYGYHFTVAFDPIRRNIVQYSSNQGFWGISQVLSGVWQSWMTTALKALLLVSITLKAYRLSLANFGLDDFARGRGMLQGLGWTFLLFFVWTPGFGVQYLSWLVPMGIFLSLPGAMAYNLFAGSFLLMVYTHWCGGFPWRLANSLPWYGAERSVVLLLWIYLVVWSIGGIAWRGLGNRNVSATAF